MYPHETEILERLWFPVARASDVDPGPVAVAYRQLHRDLLDQFAARHAGADAGARGLR